MTDVLILLAPVFLLIIMLWFGFTGCGKLLTADSDPAPTPSPTPTPTPTPPPTPYAKIVAAEPGFVVHWGLDETSGTTAIATPAGLNLNGQYLAGATLGSPGAFAAKEPGTNFAPTLNGGYIEVPFSDKLNVGPDLRFSVELWARPLGPIAAGAEQILISSHHTAGGGNQRGYEIALVGNGANHATVRGRVFSTTVANAASVDVTPIQGDPAAWKYIVLTYDGSGGPAGKKLRVWVGIIGAPAPATQEASGAEYQPVQNNQRTLRFGAGHLQAGGPQTPFVGLIDEVTFYNVVLPQVSVEAHFKAF
jgi:hypothetical protein